MSEENGKAFLEFQAYWRLAEEMIGKASKEELAVALRILAMQSAHYARKYGELELPDLTELLATVTLDEGRIGFLKDGCIALDEGGSQLH